jgi:hypothetical protein
VNPFKSLSGKDVSLMHRDVRWDDTKLMIEGGLQPRPFPDGRNAKHVYGGTVSRSVKDRRRAKNRVARKSRQKNRKRR